MKKRTPCPRCKDEEPLERKGPYFGPCHLCDGTLSISVELAAAWGLIDTEEYALPTYGEVLRLRRAVSPRSITKILRKKFST